MSTRFVLKEWVRVSIAADYFNFDRSVIYKAIVEAKRFPQKAIYQKGIHWRQPSPNLIQINVEQWEKVMNSQ